jgi:tetratricopeptide (TPR) repeat protein
VIVAALALGTLLGSACASPPPEPVARLEARQQLESGRTAWEKRQWQASGRSFERAAIAFAAIGDDAAEAAARRDQGEALRRAGEPDAAAAADRRALELDRRLGKVPEQARDLAGLARCAAAMGERDLAVATAREALALAPPATPLAAVIENDLALYLLARDEAGDHSHAVELLSSALGSNRARGDDVGIATNELNLGRAALAAADLDEADAHLQRALEHFQKLEDANGLAHTQEVMAQLDTARGDDAQARFRLEQARAGYEFLNDRIALRRLESLRSAAD